MFAEDLNIAEFSEPMSAESSVFDAEAQAINLAAKILIQMGFRSEDITIYSDSSSVIKAIKSPTMKSFLIQDTVFKLQSLAAKNTVHLQWVKAHVGLTGNEMADLLAKEGVAVEGPSCFFSKQSLKSCKKAVEQFYRFIWQQRWSSDPACRQTRLWYPVVDAKRSFLIRALSRVEATDLVRYTTGFNNLAYHSFNKKETQCDLCRLCWEAVEDCWHLATACPATEAVRQEHFIYNSMGPAGGTWRVSKLTNFLRDETISNITSVRPGWYAQEDLDENGEPIF
jgi:ribonuclease HI